METAAPMETVEKAESAFTTVPTALGKLLAKNAPSFPQFPQLRRRITSKKERKNPYSSILPLNPTESTAIRGRLLAAFDCPRLAAFGVPTDSLKKIGNHFELSRTTISEIIASAHR